MPSLGAGLALSRQERREPEEPSERSSALTRVMALESIKAGLQEYL